MPRIGTPSSNTASGARGVSSPVTLAGPPDRTTPFGSKARICLASKLLKGWISQ
jgi:hypothetical protein